MTELQEISRELELAVRYHLPTPYLAVDVAVDVVNRAREIHFLRGYSSPVTTKQCPRCHSKILCLLTSLNLKICHDCGHQFTWKLDKGQKRLL